MNPTKINDFPLCLDVSEQDVLKGLDKRPVGNGYIPLYLPHFAKSSKEKEVINSIYNLSYLWGKHCSMILTRGQSIKHYR